MTQGIYLERFLAPLRPHLARQDVTDIWINGPGELWLETTLGQTEHHVEPELTSQALHRLARQIAAASHQGLNREQPLLSASLPDGSRVQVIGPPATRGHMAIAIRRHTVSDLPLAKLAAAGLFDSIRQGRCNAAADPLQTLLEQGRYEEFLRGAVIARKTIVISGGTASGKTTLLNALIKEIPDGERLIVIEDAPEVRLPQPNALALIATRGDQGEARVDAEDLLQAALRMRPDRILIGELRGAEAFAFLRAVNTGHPGSITTVHADSTAGAIDQIAMLSMLHGSHLGWEATRAYINRVIDMIIQVERTSSGRQIVDVRYTSCR